MRTLVLLAIAVVALCLPVSAHATPHANMQDSAAELQREFVPFFGIQTWAENAQRGCVTKFITENFSSRNGATAGMNVGHFTVSKNVPGWDDVWAIRNLFNRDNFNASSHYIIDAEGHCAYIVPEGSKAWTQGNMNPWSISVEFIALGNESKAWWDNAGLRKMALVFHDAAERWNIPIRLVNPTGCTPTKGITDHLRLECGNTHTDLGANFPWTKFIALVKTAGADPANFKVWVDPVGAEKRRVVWKGAKAPAKVATTRGTDAVKPWRVTVGKTVVWRGKAYPQSVTTGRS